MTMLSRRIVQRRKRNRYLNLRKIRKKYGIQSL